jgi:predicted O-methyltransferase YrrM
MPARTSSCWTPSARCTRGGGRIRSGGLLAVDNVLSHPAEVAEVRGWIEADPHLESTVAPTAAGLLLAVRRAPAS